MRKDELRDLMAEQAALERWTGEGGSPADRFGVLARIQARLENWQQQEQEVVRKIHDEREPSGEGKEGSELFLKNQKEPITAGKCNVPLEPEVIDGVKVFRPSAEDTHTVD